MKGFSFRCVKNDPGTVSHPRGATDAARRHAVTRIRFYYRTISAPALQETGLLSHRLFLSFRKKAARIYRNRFKNACVRLSPAFRQRILVFPFVVFWHEKTGDRWCPYRTKSVFFWVWFCGGENHLRSEGLVACERQAGKPCPPGDDMNYLRRL